MEPNALVLEPKLTGFLAAQNFALPKYKSFNPFGIFGSGPTLVNGYFDAIQQLRKLMKSIAPLLVD